jgi:hypothetical protein
MRSEARRRKEKEAKGDEQKERRSGRSRSNRGSNDKLVWLFCYCWLL